MNDDCNSILRAGMCIDIGSKTLALNANIDYNVRQGEQFIDSIKTHKIGLKEKPLIV